MQRMILNGKDMFTVNYQIFFIVNYYQLTIIVIIYFVGYYYFNAMTFPDIFSYQYFFCLILFFFSKLKMIDFAMMIKDYYFKN